MLNILRELGGQYATNTPFSTFEAEKQSAIGNELASLLGCRIVTASEISDGTRLNEARIKAVTGGDPITARPLYGHLFTYNPTFHIWLAANHKPEIRGVDDGIWRRVKCIPFTASFVGREDKNLIHSLQAELPGILAWAVRGAVEWHRSGLQEPTIVSMTTQEYRTENDLYGTFLNECTELGEEFAVPKEMLYQGYVIWAKANGLDAVSNIIFSRKMSERGLQVTLKGKKRDRFYVGLRLIEAVA